MDISVVSPATVPCEGLQALRPGGGCQSVPPRQAPPGALGAQLLEPRAEKRTSGCESAAPGTAAPFPSTFTCKGCGLPPERLSPPRASFPHRKGLLPGHDALNLLKIKTRSLRHLGLPLITEMVYDLRQFWARLKNQPGENDAH